MMIVKFLYADNGRMYQAISSMLCNSTKLTEAEITSVFIGVEKNKTISLRRRSNANGSNGSA
jgi:hypothetical protein